MSMRPNVEVTFCRDPQATALQRMQQQQQQQQQHGHS